jgi:Domain of unknown function (DUF4268)
MNGGLIMKIGKIEYVDLREVWPNEAQAFTPWLEKNPEELGELLGLELELSKEHAVGSFSLDLNGVDLISGRKVIIENQLEQSDHKHLGQLLTYAGGVNPQIIIWVAKDFREEHRAALDWLNSVTGSDTNFFGVAIKAIKIGDSLAAPMLDAVVMPNTWTKEVRDAAAAVGLSERETMYQGFWSSLIDVLSANYPELVGRNPWPRAWFPTSTGVSGVNINFVFNRKAIGVEMYFGSSSEELNLERFENIRESTAHFEDLVGETLSWEELEGKKACRIALYGPTEPSVLDKKSWEKYLAWFEAAFGKMQLLKNDRRFTEAVTRH